ncbi:ATP synthase subunit B family protein [Vallitalea maricola]|uniref:Uncharacterized protein n=1 Tax=Vallitalea maricola TaxID=3074433 RepID=A0ACB5UGU9_9FIRM|nr:hypothetical protein AN2V17_10550 [Vallitalea sp. AN17-2]
MNDINESIISIIKKVRRKIIYKMLIENVLLSITGGVIACIVLAIIAHITPITFIYIKSAYIMIISMLIGVVYSLFNIPDNNYTAKIIDEKGLKERTITALELMESNNPYARIEIEDAYSHLRKIDYKKIISLKPSTKKFVLSISMVTILIIILAIPNRHRNIVEQKERMHIVKEEEKDEIEKIKKEIKKDVFLTEKDKKELEKEIAKLNKEISSINDEKEYKKQAESNKKIIEHKKNKAKEENFEKLAKKMLENNSLQELGKALSDKEFDKAKKEIDKLIEEAKKMSDKEYNDMLADLSDKLAGLDISQLQDALGDLANEMEMTSITLSNSQYASSNSNNGNPGKSQNNNQSSSTGANSAQNGQGSGQGNGQGSGQGNQQGNGNSNGKGQGRGKGSANSETDNESLDASTQDKNINGKRGNKDDSQIQMTKEGISIGGEKVPYVQVIGEYESKAYESMNTSDIPKGMQEVVKEYFSGLN